jgi:hypothetical protein
MAEQIVSVVISYSSHTVSFRIVCHRKKNANQEDAVHATCSSLERNKSIIITIDIVTTHDPMAAEDRFSPAVQRGD